MAWTSHGHQIPGTPVELPEPKTRARCGGPGRCAICSRESKRQYYPDAPLELTITTKFLVKNDEKAKYIQELYDNLHALIDCEGTEITHDIQVRSRPVDPGPRLCHCGSRTMHHRNVCERCDIDNCNASNCEF